MENDPQVVRLRGIEIYGPGPGTLLVKLSESSLYDHPWISIEPIEHPGVVYGGSLKDGEYVLSKSFASGKSISVSPDTVKLTDEQNEWIKKVIPPVAKKFLEMEAIIDLVIFD